MVDAETVEAEVEKGTVVLGRYQVVGKLAQGGMAEVYLARDVTPGRDHALAVCKRVRPHLAKDEDFVGMFVNEARLAAMINHPNVVRIYDLGQEHGVTAGQSDWFLAMEYLDGRDMLQVGRACRAYNKAVPFDVTARIIADACAGLEYAHHLRGVDGKPLDLVHRDMSPENVIVTFDGQVKVVDFGIAKARDNAIRTQAGQIKGKLGYVAPEAILGKPVDARADVFAVGATLYLFLSGRPAFSGTSPMEIFERSLKPPPAPLAVNPRVPPALDEICMRALAQDRDKRYPSAGALRDALNAYLATTGRPLGAPQLSQFMRILFPPDKDPVRQRIDGFLAAAPQLSQRATDATIGPAPRSVSVPDDDDDDEPFDADEATARLTPPRRSIAPRAVDLPQPPPRTLPGGSVGVRAASDDAEDEDGRTQLVVRKDSLDVQHNGVHTAEQLVLATQDVASVQVSIADVDIDDGEDRTSTVAQLDRTGVASGRAEATIQPEAEEHVDEDAATLSAMLSHRELSSVVQRMRADDAALVHTDEGPPEVAPTPRSTWTVGPREPETGDASGTELPPPFEMSSSGASSRRAVRATTLPAGGAVNVVEPASLALRVFVLMLGVVTGVALLATTIVLTGLHHRLGL